MWNPVGSLSDVRNYFEHSVRVPVEWILAVFPIAWLIQRNHGYKTAAAVFVPIAVLILVLTSPHHGEEYLSILRYEIYLDPFPRRRTGGGAKFVLAILSIPAVLALIAIVLSSIVWIPAGIVLLPAWLFWVVSQPFKVVYFLVVKAPFMVLHYLHYLMVPHPLEEVVKKYEEVRAQDGAKTDHRAFAEKMAQAKYDRIRDGLPAWWKSKNLERRLKNIMALRGRVHVEKDVADKYTEQFRKDQ